jgi:hypothetical protein
VKRQQLRVEVAPSTEPIDLRKWANNYCRHVLELEGVAVSSEQPQVEPLKAANHHRARTSVGSRPRGRIDL